MAGVSRNGKYGPTPPDNDPSVPDDRVGRPVPDEQSYPTDTVGMPFPAPAAGQADGRANLRTPDEYEVCPEPRSENGDALPPT